MSHKDCPSNTYFVYLVLVTPVFVKAWELASGLYNTVLLETPQIGVCTLRKQLRGNARSCCEQKRGWVPVSDRLSLFCPVPECLSQAEEAERLHPAGPQRYVQVPSLSRRRDLFLCVAEETQRCQQCSNGSAPGSAPGKASCLPIPVFTL